MTTLTMPNNLGYLIFSEIREIGSSEVFYEQDSKVIDYGKSPVAALSNCQRSSENMRDVCSTQLHKYSTLFLH
jgi:hypothetical protein